MRLFRSCLVITAVGLALAGAAPVARAAGLPGSLDSSFASGGVFTGDQSSPREGADAVALQDDGKIVYGGITTVAGQQEAMVGRLRPSGFPDPAFAGDGFIAFPAGRTTGVNSVAIAGDGKILVGGVSAYGGVMSFLLARLTQDGELDPSFGDDGIVTTPIGSSALGMSVAVQDDGRIVEAGSTLVRGRLEFAAARYTDDGSLDPSFGLGGLIALPIGTNAAANGVVVQPDGQIDLGGQATVSGVSQFAAVQLMPDGVPDLSFGKRGAAVVRDGGAAVGTAITLQPDGRILLGGGGFPGYPTYAALRLTADGAPDDSFGTNGVANMRIPGGGIANAIALQDDGKVVLAGVANVGGNPFGAARLNADGSTDAVFGTLGFVTNLLEAPMAPNGVAIQPDGKIVVAGARQNDDGTTNTVLARLNG